MAGRVKKPTIKAEQRLDWLRRYEDGESPPKIADSDGVDVRTVRKHVEQAKQEKEVKEARSVVLRSALERHYMDLCSYAAKLGQQTFGQTSAGSLPDEYMRPALRQHLPRSPIWGYLNQKDNLEEKVTQLKQDASKKIEELAKTDPRLASALTQTEIGVIKGVIDAMKFQLEQWAIGYRGLVLENDFIQEPGEEGFVNLRYGFSQMGKVAKSHVQIIREVLKDFEKRLKEWQEYKKLEEASTELKRVEKNLRDEIAVIVLRRIVPGRCRYCPI